MNAEPLLYLTDGTTLANGQANRLDLLNPHAGYMLDKWLPAIAQYKQGGYWSDSPLGAGRMLTMRRFANAVEVFDLKARAKDQDGLIAYVNELLMWQEAAADYWTSRWGERPVYLVARAAYESNTRYALVQAMSVPQLADPYDQPFLNRGGSPLTRLTLRLERGPWRDQPPGETSCVAVGNAATWVFTQWDEAPTPHTGVALAMVEAANGDLLIGSDDTGKVFSSSDGQVWSLLATLGTDPADAVNGLCKDGAGNLFAAVSGDSSVAGVWKSTNDGANWTRLVGGGAEDWQFYDIAYNSLTGVIQAVGWALHPVHGVRAAAYSDSLDGTLFVSLVTSWFYYKAVAVAFDHSWPNALLNYDPGGATGNAWVHYAALSRLSSNVYTSLGPYAYGGYDLVHWPTTAASPNPDNVLASLKTPSAGTHTLMEKLFLGGGGYYYAAISQILNDAVLALYADPATTEPAKHIYAGGNGTIYVSRNGGYSWETLTAVPATAIRSFLRTSGGALLAAGDGEVFLLEGGGAIETSLNQATVGRAATCTPAVYAANQAALSNLTHVTVYDASVASYTDNYPAAAFPFNLLPATPAAGDILYLGGQTDLPDTEVGPFSSIVFEIGTAARDVTTIVWEYWSGAAWSSLDVEDRTLGFTQPGPASVAWSYPANWATTAVNGITGYWVRARVTAVGAAPAAATQADRDVYSVRAPYVELADDQIAGTLPAAMRLSWANVGDDAAASTPDLEIDRLIVGLRSSERGDAFNAYLNASDQQMPFGVTVSVTAPAAFGAGSVGTGRRVVFTAGAGDLNAWKDAVTWSLSTTVARDYYGSFRAFVRGQKTVGGLTDVRVRLKVTFGSGGGATVSQAVYPGGLGTFAWEALDLGRIDIPNQAVIALAADLGDTLTLAAQVYIVANGAEMAFYDLVLIPVDEWAADSLIPALNTSDASQVDGESVLEIDSTANPKAPITALNRTLGGLIQARYQAIANGPAILQPRAAQRLWFLAQTYVSGPYWRSYPEILGRVQVDKVQHYLGLRGDS